MSVINKMLRDLDSRNARATVKKEGVQSVPPQLVRDRRVVSVSSGSAAKLLGALLFLVALAAGVWESGVWTRFVKTQPVAVAVSAPVAPPLPPALAASVASAAASAPSALAASSPELAASAPPSVAASAPAVVLSAPVAQASVPLPVPAALPASSAPVPPVTAPTVPTPKVVPPTAAAVPASRPPVTSPIAAKPLTTSTVPASLEAQRQQAAADAVANAQSQWNAGARDAAIRLLQDVLLSAERSVASGAPLGTGVLALVRELTRMQLADARPGAAWDVLVRLEPHVRNEADLWAVRGNAAQRLGRHSDSVLAYTAALQMRPGEQRWMLGAAVSLAAVGKTDEAAGMVEKAQSAGPVSKEVQNYLRQMGVRISD